MSSQKTKKRYKFKSLSFLYCEKSTAYNDNYREKLTRLKKCTLNIKFYTKMNEESLLQV